MENRSNCSVTHLQLERGVCPHCQLPILDGVVSAASVVVRGEPRIWNLKRMMEDLQQADEEWRLLTVNNMIGALPAIEDVLPILGRALADSSKEVRAAAYRGAVLLRSKVQDRSVAYLEARLLRDPADLAVLHVLLAFYGTEQLLSETWKKSRQAHILRLIANMPDSELAGSRLAYLFPEIDGEVYDQGRSLWLCQVQRHHNNVKVIGNAAGFLRLYDDVLAGELFRRCKTLEPENPRWMRRLGALYHRAGVGQPGDSGRDWDLMSLAELENALRCRADQKELFLLLSSLPGTAFGAGEYQKARQYAEELLACGFGAAEPWRRGTATHIANTVLGRLALISGDLPEAKERLQMSVTPVCQLSPLFFPTPLGPDMSLALDLLRVGEKEAILKFLRECIALQPGYRDRFASWSSEIEKGTIPDFRGFVNF